MTHEQRETASTLDTMKKERDIRILLLEDNATDALLCERSLQNAGIPFVLRRVESREEFLFALLNFTPDIVIADLMLLSFDGMTALLLTRKHSPELPVIILGSDMGVETVVKTIKAGAADYVLKNNMLRLGPAVESALYRKQIALEKERPEQTASQTAYDELEMRVRESTAELPQAAIILKKTKAVQSRTIDEAEQRACDSEKDRDILHALMENIPEGITIADVSGRILYVSRYTRELTGNERQELEGHNIADRIDSYRLFHTNDKMPIQQSDLPLLRAMKHNEIITDEDWVIERFDGKRLNVSASAAPIHDVNDAVTGGILTLRDITARKNAETVLRESEQNYRDLVQGIDSIVVRVTPEGTITFANRFALDFFGYTETELIGKPVVGVIVPPVDKEGRELSMIAADIFHHPEQYRSNDTECMKKSGERVWVQWSNRVIQKPDGSLKEILSTGIDVTSRNKADELLRLREEQFRTLVEQSPEVITQFDRNLRHLYINPAGIRITSRATTQQVLGKTLDEIHLFSPAINAAHNERIRAVFEKGQELRWSSNNMHPAGHTTIY
jgi:PAS domain S-box-containing protein